MVDEKDKGKVIVGPPKCLVSELQQPKNLSGIAGESEGWGFRDTEEIRLDLTREITPCPSTCRIQTA